METNDLEWRILTVTPENVEALPEFNATTWRLVDEPPAGGAHGGRAYQVLQGTVVETPITVEQFNTHRRDATDYHQGITRLLGPDKTSPRCSQPSDSSLRWSSGSAAPAAQ